MNYGVSSVEQSIGGHGFNIVDSHQRPVVHFEFQAQDKAAEAHRVIGEAIAEAAKITPFPR